jgi:hypothetical protein
MNTSGDEACRTAEKNKFNNTREPTPNLDMRYQPITVRYVLICYEFPLSQPILTLVNI